MRSLLIKIFSYLLFSLLMMFSWLPLIILYFLGDILDFILFYVIRYRRKVVMKNLSTSLPAGVDLEKTARTFYTFLSEIVVESVKCFSIGRKNLLRRIECANPEIMERLAKEKRSVIFLSGHYGDWELLIYAMNLLFPHWAIGVGKPLTNPVLNRLINGRRSRFGMKIINAANIKTEFENDRKALTASLFLSDQFPGHNKKGYETIFLNKRTVFMFGAEKYAATYNFPVVYGALERIRRGRYKLHLTLITDQPATLPSGEIMRRYVELLEQSILQKPAFWLWSHKRWKDLPGFS
ncbi:MAG: lysophospholipid acyltransferase family protein [Bacteroidetes bacterium]|nr:lysophospholipid acyltransferase family protein [Bacteroidota bacterium]